MSKTITKIEAEIEKAIDEEIRYAFIRGAIKLIDLMKACENKGRTLEEAIEICEGTMKAMNGQTDAPH